MTIRKPFSAALLALAAYSGTAAGAEPDPHATLIARIAALADDPDPRVRMQAALTIGGLPEGERTGPLARIAARDASDPVTRKAILASAGASGPELYLAVADLEGAGELQRQLAALVGARNQADEITRLVNALPDLSGVAAAKAQAAALTGLKEGLGLAGVKAMALEATAPALSSLAASGGPAAAPARAIAPVLLGPGAAFLEEDHTQALAIILDHAAPLEQRLGALAAFEPREAELERLAALLHPAEPTELQAEVIERLDALEAPGVGPLVAAAFPGLDPSTRNRALEVLYGRRDRVAALLDALADGKVNGAQIDSSWRNRLVDFPDAELAKRAAGILKETLQAADPAVLESYRAALDLNGTVANGSEIHKARCAQCHRVGTMGFDVGPAWAGVKSNPPEKILAAILYPNQSIAAGFTDFVVELNDGDITTGIIAASSPASITLRRAGGEEEIILRRNIKSMRDTAFSLMPENIYEGLSPQDMADLLAFISSAE